MQYLRLGGTLLIQATTLQASLEMCSKHRFQNHVSRGSDCLGLRGAQEYDVYQGPQMFMISEVQEAFFEMCWTWKARMENSSMQMSPVWHAECWFPYMQLKPRL